MGTHKVSGLRFSNKPNLLLSFFCYISKSPNPQTTAGFSLSTHVSPFFSSNPPISHLRLPNTTPSNNQIEAPLIRRTLPPLSSVSIVGPLTPISLDILVLSATHCSVSLRSL
ncbi:hypothetical protein NE237_006368 [Protea cynaroides]|uniref:Uncharacterized protein n=1 Tax=Protea cynaroides TaxID=273540 RepID=A0A9Q0KN07_9MAGN|nr:hypothetical protein NE237_006368 [Protea cynaroides]